MAIAETLSLVSILLSPYLTEGVITNISVIQIPQWFFPLTPYEAIFAGLTFLWICMLGYIGVIPMNLNSLFYGSPSGRRKRRQIFNGQSDMLVSSQTISLDFATGKVTDAILTTLKRLDKDECVPLALCELEHQITFGYEPPSGIQKILNGLKWSRRLRRVTSNSTLDAFEPIKHAHPLKFYENAVNEGYTATNSTATCEERYISCSMSSDKILEYVSTLHFDEI